MTPDSAPSRSADHSGNRLEPGQRPMRRDARKNAERLRETALALMRARGASVPLEEIAAAAGVSIGTLYNHFRTRESLIAEIAPGLAREERDRVVAAVTAGSCPASRMELYLRTVLTIQADDHLLADALNGRAVAPDEVTAICLEVVQLGERLVSELDATAPLATLLSDGGLRGLLAADAGQPVDDSGHWSRLRDNLLTLAHDSVTI